MSNSGTLFAALSSSELLTAGAASAANENVPSQQGSADKEFRKLPVGGSSAVQDLMLARSAIFDGRIDDAKKPAPGASAPGMQTSSVPAR